MMDIKCFHGSESIDDQPQVCEHGWQVIPQLPVDKQRLCHVVNIFLIASPVLFQKGFLQNDITQPETEALRLQ